MRRSCIWSMTVVLVIVEAPTGLLVSVVVEEWALSWYTVPDG